MRIAYILAVAGSLAVVFSTGYAVGASKGHSTAKIAAGDEVGSEQQINDAIYRWSVKAGEPSDRIREHWLPRSMFIPTRNQASGMTCVQLRLEPGAMGGEPVYCYENDTTALLAEYSNVE